MNRRYNSSDYKALVDKLRCHFDDCAITTDIMVGFPGETEDDFNTSVDFVRSIGFAKAHIFPYSRRDGTPAAEYPDQISDEEKKRRAAVMAEAAEASQNEFLQNQVGKTYPVLFEREKIDGFPNGYTPNYTKVKIFTKYSDKSLRNQIFYVKIIRLEDDYCIGELIT